MFIRDTTLLHGLTHALYEIPTYLRQLTYASTLQHTRFPFGCTLSGPSYDLNTARLSPPRTLCRL